MTLETVLLVSGIIFAIGLYGVLSRRNTVALIMSLELMFNAVVIAAVAFSRFTPAAGIADNSSPVTAEALRRSLTGHVFAVLVISVAAAETALALALVFALYRRRETVEITELSEMHH
jgi:NADH:ubiquinone oxidoreductase subunit K